MRGNIVLAAAILAVGLVGASAILVWGIHEALDSASADVAGALRQHAESTHDAGAKIAAATGPQLDDVATALAAAGDEIRTAGRSIGASVESHATATQRAAENISQPHVTMKSPVPITNNQTQPLRIQGPDPTDDALPVSVELGADGESEKPRQRQR